MNSAAETAKSKIDQAFYNLYEEKNLEKITITEVTGRAGVYRGTFYYYYKDIYDLFEKLEGEIAKIIRTELPEIIFSFVEGNIAENIRLLEIFYSKYERLLLLFLIKKPSVKLSEQMKEMIKEIVITGFGLEKNSLTEELAAIMEFVASGQQGLLIMWLKSGRKMSTEQLGGIMKICTQHPIEEIMKYAIRLKC
ncbi:TetR family transcriptional regulator [Kineothrix alysoides]|uniref:TetR family transcriptional regulator n=1 Tax=Kineothrix alysoides TaxID=1469948 RepID=A0A4R1QU91_9FIRM|nr:TetR/AcrR family transcriptional regulator [Kineothrix alysoides]TCL56651.1 TetR family transcriptional regulator [Kineothrix alysoides]